MNKKVIYTAIIGGYDELIEPEFKPDGWDFVCFSDRDLNSNTWEIRKTIPLYSDNTRTARKHKLLTHRFLPEYDISLWVDGNIKVVGNINELLYHLDDCNLNPNRGRLTYKDNPNLIQNQMNRYIGEGYPKDNGLVVQMEVLRRHNEKDVVDSMESHWLELKHNSKREQLSFNYISWKNDLKFNYIQGDSRSNQYFVNIGKHKGKL